MAQNKTDVGNKTKLEGKGTVREERGEKEGKKNERGSEEG